MTATQEKEKHTEHVLLRAVKSFRLKLEENEKIKRFRCIL